MRLVIMIEDIGNHLAVHVQKSQTFEIRSWALSMGLATMICFLLTGIFTVTAQDTLDGRRLVEDHCGMCHATAKSGSSPNREAPPLRTIGQRFSLDVFQEMLERGTIFAPHPQMPNFKISYGAARAMTIYLRSIQDDY
jgi:hypothetical protein